MSKTSFENRITITADLLIIAGAAGLIGFRFVDIVCAIANFLSEHAGMETMGYLDVLRCMKPLQNIAESLRIAAVIAVMGLIRFSVTDYSERELDALCCRITELLAVGITNFLLFQAVMVLMVINNGKFTATTRGMVTSHICVANLWIVAAACFVFQERKSLEQKEQKA